MRFAWVGMHTEGLPALDALLQMNAPIHGVLTVRAGPAARKAGPGHYALLCQRHGVPLHRVANINDPGARDLLRALGPDVVFVIGWHQTVLPETLRLARVGMIGAHASLLPANRGSAPVNWALIRGEHQTGNTLIWLADAPDAGDLIDQTVLPISVYDTCATLYDKVAASNRDMLVRLVPRLLAGERPGRPQPPGVGPVLPRRRPADGGITWARSSREVYDFVRALTRPYPGAFGCLEGKRGTVWQAALPPSQALPPGTPPGQVLGPVISPVPESCGQLVACGDGALVLLEVEFEGGVLLRGPDLSEQLWAGQRWTDG